MTQESKTPLYLRAMARRLRVPSTWLRAEAEAGRIPHLRAGNVLLFDPETVERIVLSRLRQAEDAVETAADRKGGAAHAK